MLKKLIFIKPVLAAAAFIFTSLLPAFGADEFPTRPIKLIVPYSPGSSADISARRVGEAMSRTLGKPIVVENVAGAGGVVGTMRFLQQPADGYTLLAGAIATHAINVGIYKALPYDPVKDFAPISRISSFPNVSCPSFGQRQNIAGTRFAAKEAHRRPGSPEFRVWRESDHCPSWRRAVKTGDWRGADTRAVRKRGCGSS